MGECKWGSVKRLYSKSNATGCEKISKTKTLYGNFFPIGDPVKLKQNPIFVFEYRKSSKKTRPRIRPAF